ncbi:hypothetical protein M9H77_31281 [Catharanthus roseus]|uniref:Uncharacterized protein n=1 Tax=Catharanthus roseus TaxID=4058 RepID=A0ACC0A0G9_CATRO|nr:hypothetical protein M9H77_31281 [Catharanthus roseus]
MGTRPTCPVDSQLGSSFVNELLSRFPDVSPYNSQHMNYYGSSRHVPSYTLGSRKHSGDEGGEETVQARGYDIDFQGDDLEDKAENGQGEDKGEGKGEEDVGMGVGSSAGKKKAKKGDDDSGIQRGPTPGGPQDPKIMPSYGGHVVVAIVIWRGECGIPMASISTVGDSAYLPINITTSCYMQSMIGNSIFTDNSGLNIGMDISLFPIFASPMRIGAVAHSPYIQQFELLGTTRDSSELEYCMRFDTMRPVEVRWTL